MTTFATHPPTPVPEPGWTEYWPFPAPLPAVGFVSPGPTGLRLRVAYYKRGGDGALVGRAWFGPETEGPPGHAHGGSIAAVLDEALGACAWAAGYAIVVASLRVEFRQLVPLGTDATLETSIDLVDGRKIHTHARLLGSDGELLAEGRALCVVLGDDHIEMLKAFHERQAKA